MGQLTNLYVSESYQGLIKLTDSTTGVTGTLQSIQDGLGNNIPIKVSNSDVVITGSITNAYSSSYAVSSSEATHALSASYAPMPDVSGFVSSSTFNAYTSSNDSKVNSLINATGSYATTSSLTSLSGSIATTDLAQNNRLTSLETNSGSQQLQINQKLDSSSFNSYTSSNDGRVSSLESKTGSYATTGSNVFQGTQTISGSINITGELTALSASITYLKTIYQTSSIVFSSGSNILGDEPSDVQTLNGTVNVPIGNLNVTGATTSSLGFFGNLQGTASYATQALSASWAPDTTNTGSFVTNVAGGPISFEDQIIVTKGNGSTSTVTINNVTNADSSSFSQTSVSSSYATNALSASFATNALSSSFATNALSSSFAINATSASFATNALSASFATNATSASYASNAATASIANDLIVVGKNNNASTLTRGTIVRIVGANGDNPLFDTASWTDDANSANTLGMLSEDVASNGFANVVVQGKVLGINTNGMSAGSLLFLSSSGQYTTSSVPPPYHEVRLGQVLRSQVNNGSAYISVDNGYELSELHDVDITSPVVGDLLVYTSGSYGQWVNLTGTELGFATTGSNTFIGSQTVNGDIIISGSSNSIIVPEANYIKLYGDADGSSTSAALQFFSGSNANRWLNIQAVPTNVDGDVAISDFPSNNHFMFFKMSNHTIQFEAALAGTGSAPIETKTGFINNTFYNPTLSTNERGFINSGSMVVRGNLFNLSNNTNLNPDLYVTNSVIGQTNIIKGWGDNPAAGGAGSSQANYTGSLRITGSNNTVSLPQIRATGLGGGVDQQGYISGSDNIIAANNAGMFLNTGSLLFPKTQANFLGYGSSISMNFTTSSLAGGHPQVNSNTLYGGAITINSNSGSVTSVSTNLINAGGLTSTQNFVTNTRPTIAANIIGSQVTLNHISSSINYQSNINNSPVTINNHLSSSNITTNTLTVSNNMILGGSSNTGLGIWSSGSMSSNVTRNITDNLIGGKNMVISSSFVSSSNSNLVSTIMYGNNLVVSASHTTGTNGGSAFFGRFNDTGSLHDAQNIVFAVGTGTAAGSRRTGLYVTSGSLVGISGSAVITGSVQGNVSPLTVTSNTASLNLNNGNFFELALTGSQDIRIEPSNIKPGQTVNIKLNTTGSGTVSFPTTVKQQSGSAYVPTTEVGTDIITMVSFDSTNLYLANIKNLL